MTDFRRQKGQVKAVSPGDLPGQDRTARDTRTRNGSRRDGTPRPQTRDPALPL